MTLTPAQLAAGALMILLYPPVTVAAYYLGSRAKVTEFLWKRYPAWLDKFMLCAACVGFWFGAAAALAIGWYLDVPFLVLPGRLWLTPVVVALSSLVWTPWLAAKHLAALETTSPPAVDYSPAAYGTDASPTKAADLAYAGVGSQDDDLDPEVQANEEAADSSPPRRPPVPKRRDEDAPYWRRSASTRFTSSATRCRRPTAWS